MIRWKNKTRLINKYKIININFSDFNKSIDEPCLNNTDNYISIINQIN